MLQELLLAVRHAEERLERIEAAIAEFLPTWSLAPVVEALQALRGIGLVDRRDHHGRDRRPAPLRQPAPAHGLPGPRAGRALDAARACTGSASPRLATAGSGRRWSRAPGAIATRRGPARPSATSTSACRPPCATSPPRRRRGSAPATGRCRAGQEADCDGDRRRPRAGGLRLGDREGGAGRVGRLPEPRYLRRHPARKGGGRATAEELPLYAMWPALCRRPQLDRERLGRIIGTAVANPRIRA